MKFLKSCSFHLLFCPEIKTRVQSPDETLVDEPNEMFQLAGLLAGVSVDCTDLSSKSHSPGKTILTPTFFPLSNCFLKTDLLNASTDNQGALHSDKDAEKLCNEDTLEQVGHIFLSLIGFLGLFDVLP